MRVIKFEAQNIQRLQAVTIEPGTDASAVVLAGDNEAGKSSILDAIEMALAGERVSPPEPIRRGQEKAHIVVDLDDMIVTRRYTAKGSSLVVTNRDGLRYPSPQALLDGLYNRLTFDPMAFANAKPDEQAGILRNLAGVKTSDLEAERQRVFEARTLVNRDLTKAKAALANAPAAHADVGTELEDTAGIMRELEAADITAAAAVDADRAHASAVTARRLAEEQVKHATAAVDAARQALKRAEQDLERATARVQTAVLAVDETRLAADAAAATVPDRGALRAKVTEVQRRNQKIEANRRRADLETEVGRLHGESDGHTRMLERIAAEKADRLAAATFPIDGLGLSDAGGVTWQGLPFEQASTAIRTRVSAAIGFALNPKLRILLVRNGNDLDGRNLQLLADAAADAGGQVWIERIAGGDGLQTVVIEDGAVKLAMPAARSATKAAAGLPLEGGAR
jgi:hypothetical protein